MPKKSTRKAKPKRSSPQAKRFQPNHLYSVVFSAESLERLAVVVRTRGVDCGCRHPSFRHDEQGVHLSALVSGAVLQQLVGKRQVRAEVVADQTQASRAALALVARGDRFRKGRLLPQGTGRLV